MSCADRWEGRQMARRHKVWGKTNEACNNEGIHNFWEKASSKGLSCSVSDKRVRVVTSFFEGETRRE